ncbi:uncharacterized protein [Aegilops tauschii subsp. strangulata]|uniref:uncharacterized protein n=1 Tax=Aegilops tauschii subsp. strangulata TaxID=200361 RepID=UPI003CC85E81
MESWRWATPGRSWSHALGHRQTGLVTPSRRTPTVVITFDSRDHPESATAAGTLPMLCTPTISNGLVTKTLIDGGAGLNVLSVESFETLQVPDDQLMPIMPFPGVIVSSTTPLGQVRLTVTFGTHDNYRTELIDFDVARIGLPYNAILGYPVLAKFMAVTHPGYNVIKMPGSGGVVTIAGDKEDAVRVLKLAYRVAAASRPSAESIPVDLEAAPAKKKLLFSQYRAETKKVPVDVGGSGPTFTIGAALPPEQEEALVTFLRANKHMFAWKASNLAGVPREVIEHHLAVCPNAHPVKQKARRQALEKQAFIVQEVHKLHEAGVIREVRHREWLANPVFPNKGGKERMCVDFTSLNKACPQDPFPLPRIDQIIKMAAEDVEKTTFISPCGMYCYTCMPFGLRSVGATFQQLMHITLGPQLGRNAEAYVDDIVVKSREAKTLIEDLEETFANLRKVSLKLNPDKCVFGVPSGKLLGFLVSHQGIKANPEKIKAIEKMRPPQTLKEMQKLAGCVTSLGHFISKLGERALPFFKQMKRTGAFEWTTEVDAPLKT